MKRYLVFAGYDYYPSGGWKDFKKGFDIYREALEYCAGSTEVKYFDFVHIVDIETMQIVFRKES